MPRSLFSFAAPGAAAFVLASGCVPQDRYDQLLTANRSLQEQVAMLESERDQSNANLASVQSQLSTVRQTGSEMRRKYDDLEASLAGLTDEQKASMRRLAELEFGPLPIEIQTAIEDLAMAHPKLLTFDARAGMVRFASDLTFDLGSVAIQPEAANTIAALAKVLLDPGASGLEVRVVGHTDNVPIGKPETRRLHPTNTHLSVHRAIAVRDALASAGIDLPRMQVAGYGEFRPIIANGSKGAEGNRRVEIYLVPMTDAAATAPAAEASEPERPSGAAADPVK
jgi:chemotaxis protein MotB